MIIYEIITRIPVFSDPDVGPPTAVVIPLIYQRGLTPGMKTVDAIENTLQKDGADHRVLTCLKGVMQKCWQFEPLERSTGKNG